jgi:predicted nucleotidyltransferase
MRQIMPEIVKRLISFDDISRLIVFGSVARHHQSEDSDLDLIVIRSQVKNKHHEMVELRRSLKGIGIPIDLLVIDENEYLEKIKSPSNVYYFASKEGKIIYDTI